MLLSPLKRDLVHLGILNICLLLVLKPSPTLYAGNSAAEIDSRFAISAPLAARSLILDAYSIEGLTVVVGERGHILVSEDGGKTWTQSKVPTRTALTGVFFLNRSQGWAVGHDAVILRSVDGGSSWERMHYAPEDEIPLFDVWFKDERQGFAVGAYGLFLVTNDGGKTWTRRQLNVLKDELNDDDNEGHLAAQDEPTSMADEFAEAYDLHLNRIARADNGRLYIAAEAGNIFRSDDDGETWIALPSPYHGSFFGVLPLEDSVLLVYGLRGNLFRSEDSGETWQPVETSTSEMLTGGLRLQEGKTILVGLGGVVLISRDDRSFTPRPQPDRSGYSAIVQSAEGQVIVVGEAGAQILPRHAYTMDTQPNERSR